MGIDEMLLYRLLAGGVLLGLAVFLLERIVGRFARRGKLERLYRAVPLLGIFGFALYILFGLRALFGFDSIHFAVGSILLLLFVLFVARHVLRDLFTGAVLRSEGALSAERTILAGEIRGRIRRAGLRSLVLVLGDGREVRIPYGRLAGMPVTSWVDRETPGGHTFRLSLDSGGGEGLIKDLREYLLLHPLVSPDQEPELKITRASDENESSFLNVTVYSYGARFGDEIELNVRAWLTRHVV